MAEDIQLYKYFTRKLEEIGKVKYAWFTTFNLDISFFEKYILSALTGKSASEIKTPYDYEALSACLANTNDEFDGDKMEVRVFYDFRTLKTEGRPKQTTVHLHPVNMADLRFPEAKHFKEGVFHPKVILIQSYDDRCWLMVSSANLTLGGWARNRESFFFEEIKTTSIGREVGNFFQGIISALRSFGESELLYKLNSGKLGTHLSRWRFLSSFSEQNLADALVEADSPLPLRVWSPYFADDLSDLISEYQEEYFHSIEIIPAKTENQKIRITEETYSKCANTNKVKFKQDKLPASAQEAFVHAKVWLTPKAIAIGSWNMTRSGMNCSSKANNNIEAGIIYNLTAREYQKIEESYPLSLLRSIEYYKSEELLEEKKEILDEYIISVDVLIDWNHLKLKLIQPTYTAVVNEIGIDAVIFLPGFGKQSIRFLEEPQNFGFYDRQFLSDRFFEISDKAGKTLYKGYAREIGLESRPVNSFENIDDYLKGWVSEIPEEKTELHRIGYGYDEEDEFSEQIRTILTTEGQNSWFSSFHAFECMVNRIKKTKEMYAADRVAELKRIGRILPGSLKELKMHLEKLLDLYISDRKNFQKSPLYLWFLVERANAVFSFFNHQMKFPEEHIRPIKNIEFEHAIDKNHLSDSQRMGLNKWKRFIKSQMKEI